MIKSCDRVTGKCDNGCKPGWAGTTCDKGNRIILHVELFGSILQTVCWRIIVKTSVQNVLKTIT